jgi:chaperonin GroEL
MEYQKAKSASKVITVKGNTLRKRVLGTMDIVSSIVGSTLGPSGQPVLIERFEHGLPPLITKDGVTVMRALGMADPTDHCIMEAARDAAVKTANEAGDGTTTATVLSEALVRYIDDFCKRNPHVSPQKVVRTLETTFRDQIVPAIEASSIVVKNDRKLQKSVAKISANNEEDLAEAVMQCFDEIGDEGNVTILERSGPTGYQVERLEGYPIPIGYEQSCAKYYSAFINDAGTQKVVMEKPVFLLYHGVINDVQPILPLLQKVGDQLEMRLNGGNDAAGQPLPNFRSDYRNYNVVVIATGFSPKVIASFAHASTQPNSIRIFPLLVPLLAATNGQRQFLEDLAAVTGAVVFDPITNPPDRGELEDLGPGLTTFESSRFRSIIIGRAEGQIPEGSVDYEKFETYEDRLLARVADVEALLRNPESDADKIWLQERVGKLTGGIAKLHVVGSSNGELKEKAARAEDAVCAVRGAIRYGCLPGGGWMLLKLCSLLSDADAVVSNVLKPALIVPVDRLLKNCGFNDNDIKRILSPVLEGLRDGKTVVYDAYEHRHGDPVELGVLDSTPAVLEAIRNAISIASQLGTLGGTVVFHRDTQFERTEAHNAQDFERNANINEANER